MPDKCKVPDKGEYHVQDAISMESKDGGCKCSSSTVTVHRPGTFNPPATRESWVGRLPGTEEPGGLQSIGPQSQTRLSY